MFHSYFPPFSLIKIKIERRQAVALCPPNSYLPVLVLPAREDVNGSPDDSEASPPGPAPASRLLAAGVHTGLGQPRALLSGHFIAKGGILT